MEKPPIDSFFNKADATQKPAIDSFFNKPVEQKVEEKPKEKQQRFRNFMDASSAKMFTNIGSAAGALEEGLGKAGAASHRAFGKVGGGILDLVGSGVGIFSKKGKETFNNLADELRADTQEWSDLYKKTGKEINSFLSEGGRLAEEQIISTNPQLYERYKTYEERLFADGVQWKDLSDRDFILFDLWGGLIENSAPLALAYYTGGKAGSAQLLGNSTKLAQVANFITQAGTATAVSTGVNALREAESTYTNAIKSGKSEQQAFEESERVFRRNGKANVGFEAIQMASVFFPALKTASPLVNALVNTGKYGVAGTVEAVQERGEDAIQQQAGSEDFDYNAFFKEVTKKGITRTDAVSFILGIAFQGFGDVVQSVNGGQASPEFEAAKSRIENSQAFDIEQTIAQSPEMAQQIYQNQEAGILTENFAKVRVADVAQKLDQYQKGLGEQYLSQIDQANTTMQEITDIGVQVLETAKATPDGTPRSVGNALVEQPFNDLVEAVAEKLPEEMRSGDPVEDVATAIEQSPDAVNEAIEKAQGEIRSIPDAVRKETKALRAIDGAKIALEQGANPLEVKQELSTIIGAKDANDAVSDLSASINPTEQAQKEFGEINDQLTPFDVQQGFDNLNQQYQSEFESTASQIAQLRDDIKSAPDRSARKSQLKKELSKAQDKQNTLEKRFSDDSVSRAQSVRSFITDFVSKNFPNISEQNAKRIVNTVGGRISSPGGIRSEAKLGDIIRTTASEVLKTPQKVAKNPEAKKEKPAKKVEKQKPKKEKKPLVKSDEQVEKKIEKAAKKKEVDKKVESVDNEISTDAEEKGFAVDLSSEAKKYDSAEEFAQAKLVYHFTGEQFDEFDLSKTADRTIWFTTKETPEGLAATGSSIRMERGLQPKKVAGWDQYDNKSLSELENEGYDLVELPDDGYTDYIVLDTSILKTREELEEIWREANKSNKNEVVEVNQFNVESILSMPKKDVKDKLVIGLNIPDIGGQAIEKLSVSGINRALDFNVLGYKPELIKGTIENGFVTDGFTLYNDEKVVKEIEKVARKKLPTYDNVEVKDVPNWKDVVPDDRLEANIIGHVVHRKGEVATIVTDGNYLVPIDTQKLAPMLKFFPDATIEVAGERKPVVFTVGGEIKGLIMPLNELPVEVSLKIPEVEPTVEAFASADEIDVELSNSASRGLSFTPEKRGATYREEYATWLNDIRDEVLTLAKSEEQTKMIEAELVEFKKRFKAQYETMLSSKSKVMSPMIAGPAKFPVERNRKRMESAMKHSDRLSELSDNFRKRINTMLNKQVIEEAGGVQAYENDRLKEMEDQLALMKNANKIIRKKSLSEEQKVEQLKELGLSEESIELLSNPKNSWYKPGFQSFELTSLNNKIKRLKSKAERREKLDERPPVEKLAKFDGGEIVRNNELDRVQIIYDAKPDSETITSLKKSGWKWSPSNSAWQRKITTNAYRSAQSITGATKEGQARLRQVPKHEYTDEQIELRSSMMAIVMDAGNGLIDTQEASAQIAVLWDQALHTMTPEQRQDFDVEARYRLRQKDPNNQTTKDRFAFLEDIKKRWNIDFDVHFVDTILAGEEFTRKEKSMITAYGAFADNTIAITRDALENTDRHEVVHLTMANAKNIPIMRENGITRKAVLSAKAEELGQDYNNLSISEKIELEERVAEDFEEYRKNKYEAKGIFQKFFVLLNKLIAGAKRFFGLKRDVIQDYYDLLDFGRDVDADMAFFENKGMFESFIDGGVLDLRGTPLEVSNEPLPVRQLRLKAKPSEDKNFQRMRAEHNKAVREYESLEKNTQEWKEDLEKEIIRRKETAEVIAGTPKDVKDLARFTTRKPPRKLTERGEEKALEFENPEEAVKEVEAYMQRKAELVHTRNRLRTIRRELSQMREDTKDKKEALKDIKRRLEARRIYLERKDRHVKQGKREQMRMIAQRMRVLRGAQDFIGLSDARVKDLIGGLGRNRIHTMTEKEFDNFMIQFTNRGMDIANRLEAQDSVKALIQEMQFNKTENLRRAMGLPPISKMNEEQATRFEDVLSKYEFGDTFLTQRQIETIHRTKWAGAKSKRELEQLILEKTNITRKDLETVEVQGDMQQFKNWLVLSRENGMFAWLVDERIKAKVQQKAEMIEFEKEMIPIAKKARDSRAKKLGTKEKIINKISPTDEMVFDYIESENKEEFAQANEMTKEEIEFAEFLIGRLFEPAREYLTSEYGMNDRENYVTHIRRTASEAFFDAMRDGKSVVAGMQQAVREMLTSQKEELSAFKILAGKTGEVLAFEKFFKFALPRTGNLKPTKNLARASLSYANAYFNKKALDRLIPEAVALAKYQQDVKGYTEKGLPVDPTVEQFVNQFLNDAKGRKIKFISEQGSGLDNALRLGVAWTAFKYLGFRPLIGMANFVGEFVGTIRATTPKELWNGFSRSLQIKKAIRVNQAHQYFIGRNPVVEMFDPQWGISQRMKQAAMLLFSLSSYFTNDFYLRAKMTPEEWHNELMSDDRMVVIVREMSKWRNTDFYIKALAGNTAFGSAFNQFATWAFPIVVTTLSDVSHTYKNIRDRGVKKGVTSEEAISLGKTLAVMGTLMIIANTIKQLQDVDDNDRDIWFYLTREMNTFLGAFQTVINFEGRIPLARDVINFIELVIQAFDNERYTTDGAGYGIGDSKAAISARKFIEPVFIRSLRESIFGEPEQQNTKLDLIDKAIQKGEEINPDEILEFISPDEWNNTAGKRTPEEQLEYQEKKRGEITRLYYLRKDHADNMVGDIVTSTKSNSEKVEEMLSISEENGVDAVYNDLKELYSDRNLCSNPTKRTGCIVSGNLFKDFQRARRDFNN